MNRPPKIFISYRQADSSDTTNHLHENLTGRFGRENVFMDIRSLKGGDDLFEVIRNNINSYDVVLVIIGKSWVSSIKQKQAEGKVDIVRFEVATALEARPKKLVIPVLVQGASFPAESDLPDDIQGLTPLIADKLEVRSWSHDVEQLIDHMKTALGIGELLEEQDARTQTQPRKPRRSNFEISTLGGALAGMLMGTVVGIAYSFTEKAGWLRPLFVMAYGLVAGGVVAGFINAGIEKSKRVGSNVLRRRFTGALFGGALGGLISGLIGLLFGLFSDDVVNVGWVVAAVATSSFFITAGILLPDLRQDWFERLLILVGIAVVTIGIAFVAALLLFMKVEGLEKLMRGNLFVIVVPLLGALYGAMAGAQVGLALVIYELRSRHAVETT